MNNPWNCLLGLCFYILTCKCPSFLFCFSFRRHLETAIKRPRATLAHTSRSQTSIRDEYAQVPGLSCRVERPIGFAIVVVAVDDAGRPFARGHSASLLSAPPPPPPPPAPPSRLLPGPPAERPDRWKPLRRQARPEQARRAPDQARPRQQWEWRRLERLEASPSRLAFQEE